MKNAVNLWLDEMMDQPIRQLIDADGIDFKIIMDFIRSKRLAKKEEARAKKGGNEWMN